MERKSLYLYAAISVVVAVLLIVAVSEFYDISLLNGQLGVYQKQQKEVSTLFIAEHAADMDAARQAWITANQRDYLSLQNEGIVVEADSVQTSAYTVILDLQDPSGTRIDSTPGDMQPGEAEVYLGQYYSDNMTLVPGWQASYTVNTTTHAVSGLTPLLIQNIAYAYYSDAIVPDLSEKLGVSSGTVTGYSARHIDCSLLDSGVWQDVTEYEYTLRNTDVKDYLLIKTYVNASAQSVTSVDISQPYDASVTGSPL